MNGIRSRSVTSGLLPLLGSALLVVSLLGSFVAAGAPQARANGAPTHAPIVITKDTDFTSCACVTSGTGTATNPYVIGPWAINNAGVGVAITGGASLTKSFVLSNLTIAGNSAPTTVGIHLSNINVSVAKVTGIQTSIQTTGTGILVENSSNVTLDGGGANKKGPGVGMNAGTINHNSVGAIDVENSSGITIRGWQLSADGADGSPDYVAFNPAIQPYWNVGGVRFFGVTNSTIDHTAANNDTSISYSLFDSSNDTISNNTANYPFTTNVLITDGSSYNQVTGNDFSTGDFFGILIADPLPGTWTFASFGATHDNRVQGNFDHSDGPTGTEVAAGIAPAFLGSIVVLNGTYNNTITGNTAQSSTGGNLVWAQAVPNSSTPIGVDNYPPVEHCNVTASEGGGGLLNLNGNVWTGNSVQQQDPCIPVQ